MHEVIDAPTPEAGGQPTGRRITLGRVVIIVLIAGMLAMWGYVAYLALGPGRAEPPDKVADAAFAPAAEARCAEAITEVAQLPPAMETPEPVERADVLDEANAIFADMLDDLDELVPEGDDGRIVTMWLADWRTYLGDREEYAAALRVDPETRLYITEAPGGRQITQHIDDFAADNSIPACSTPLDV